MADLPKLPNQPSEKDISEFLSKVDEIENVIKGLNSEDDEKRSQFMTKADKLIEKVQQKENVKTQNDNDDENLPQTRTGFNKTSINKDAYKNDAPQPLGPQDPVEPMDQRAFMAAMEADAQERADRRKERQKIADGFKEQGNAEFKQGNFQKALECYDKAMEQIRDSTALYTNRAQAKIKLGMFKEALTDCDWALRRHAGLEMQNFIAPIWPNCLKALVHQGRAYLGLKEYNKARESYKQILSIDSRKENIVKEYLAEVERVEHADKEETKATQLFEEGDQITRGVVDLLTRVNSKDQLPMYYAGGFRVITAALENAESQAIFRTNGGLQLPLSHPVLKRCLSAYPLSLSAEERDMVTSALDMLTAACKDNETSQQQLLSQSELTNQLTAILEAKFKGQGRLLRTSCLTLLHEASLCDAGRAAIVNKFDVHRLIGALFPLMMKKSTYASLAAALMNNIALDKRLKTMLRDNIENSILPAFEKLLQNNKTSPSIAGQAASIATNLAADVMIRNKMAARASLWNGISTLLRSYTGSKLCDPLEYLLGVAVNLTSGVESASLKNLSLDVTKACDAIIVSDSLSEMVVTRALAVLSNILPHSETAAKHMCGDSRPEVVLELMRKEDPLFYKSALKCMTAVTQHSEAVRTYLAENKGTSTLVGFLNSEDEVVVGNAALCLSHLCQVGKVCAKLTKTNIVQKLLVLARDGHKPSVQSNCAILIGKLAQGDSRHLERLRELHGIEILHGCMKHVK